MSRSLPIALITTGILAAPVAAQREAAPPLVIRALSTKPELVSGGDVLVEITSADGSAARNVSVRLNGRNITVTFRPVTYSKSLMGLVTGLQTGPNVIEASVGRNRTASQLTVVNHPIAGPVLYSPRQSPFICETEAHGLGAALDVDCSVATRVDYFYRSTNAAPAGPAQGGRGNLAAADNANGFGRGNAAANPFRPLDPNGPRPSDVATTTTTEGKTVPYIVRREMGTINRAVYSIAFLHEPGTPLPSPFTTGPTWNGRLVYAFGGGVAAGYHQGRTVGGLNGNRSNIEDGQLGDYAVSRGYAVAGASLNVFGTHANDVVSAETMMMVKEHFAERFGVPRWTIGSGRSGGSMQQHLIANNYPGLLDAIVPTASFADTMTFHMAMSDCELLDAAMATSRLPWTTGQKTAVSGYSHWDYCTNNKLRYAPLSADMNCDGVTIPPAMRFNAVSNRTGVRCTYQDSLVSVFGRDLRTSFARRPFDNVGVQYGLAAFNAGRISFAQFVDINRRVGGHDMNGQIVPARTVADSDALKIAYATGRINDTAHGLGLIPIIDMRPYTEGPGGDVHDTYSGAMTRARIVAAFGSADNHISRVYEPGASIVRAQSDNLDILDRWLAAIAVDAGQGTPREKMLRNKPAGLTDSCFTAALEEIKDPAKCRAMFAVYGNPRSVAGAPPTGDRLKCELKQLDASDYRQPLTDVQISDLRGVFPQGVCDHSKPGIAQQPAQTWLTYPVRNATQTATAR